MRIPICIIVAGVHRSGTSLLTGVLSFLGAQPPSNIVAAGKYNLKGFWEPLEILRLNESIFDELQTNWEDWRQIDFNLWSVERRAYYKDQIKRLIAEEYPDAMFFVLKEPRLTRLIPLYHEALTEMGIDVVYALSLRAPDDVVGSIRTANPLKSKNGAYLLWLRYIFEAEFDTRAHRRVIVPFSNLLSDWKSTCWDLADQLAIPLNLNDESAIDKLNSFISDDLVHHKSVVTGNPDSAGPIQWARDVYELLLATTLNQSSQIDWHVLDKIRSEFERDWPKFAKVSEASRQYKRNIWAKFKRELTRIGIKIRGN